MIILKSLQKLIRLEFKATWFWCCLFSDTQTRVSGAVENTIHNAG